MVRITKVREMRSAFLRIWNSPTYTTWGGLLVNSLSAVVVLPLVLTKFSTPEITLWYLMMTFIGLQSVVDAGFSPTFSRIITYLMGGLPIRELRRPTKGGTGILDENDLNRVFSTMRSVYWTMALAWTGLLAVVGYLALRRPISHLEEPLSGWLAWGVIVAVSGFAFSGERYASYLLGLNQVAVLRRWDAIAGAAAILTSFLVLFGGGGLLGLVIANQFWLIFRVVRNRWLCRSVLDGLMRRFTNQGFDRDIFAAVWPSAWRSGIGILMSSGIIQSSGIIYAQVGSAASVASYLLGLRFMQIVTQFSMAPFYSKIPLYSRLYAEEKKTELLTVAQRGMRLSHWAFVLGFTGIAFLAEPALSYIGSNASFPSPLLWSLMGLAFFVERFGAMHIQLYSATNHITWHIANGVTGIIYLAVSLTLLKSVGAYAFPIGMLAGYVGFYSWFTARQSYKAFELRPFSFEKSASVVPATLLVTSIAALLVLRH